MTAPRVLSVTGPGSDPSQHVVAIEPSPRRVRVFFGDQVIADSTRVGLLFETGLLPIYYFPGEDVKMDWLHPTDRTSDCPYKGRARYWTVKAGDRAAENAAWSYPEPTANSPDLSQLIAFDWRSMDAWYEEDDEVFVHPRSPYHRVDVVESSRCVEVKIDGVTVAESSRPRFLYETGLPTRYYLPKLDVRTELLRPEKLTTRCPYKGVASYWSVSLNGKTHENIVWSYRAAIPENPKIAGLLCFFNEKVDIYIDGELEERPSTQWS